MEERGTEEERGKKAGGEVRVKVNVNLYSASW